MTAIYKSKTKGLLVRDQERKKKEGKKERKKEGKKERKKED